MIGRQFLDPFGPDRSTDVEKQGRRLHLVEATRRVWGAYHMPTVPTPGEDVSDAYYDVKSASFVRTWIGRLPALIGPAIEVGVYVYLYVATNSEVRLAIDHPDGTVYSAADAQTSAGGEFHALTATWLHGQRLWVGDVTCAIEVRRTLANGFDDPVLVQQPSRLGVRGPEEATSGPTWTEVV